MCSSLTTLKWASFCSIFFFVEHPVGYLINKSQYVKKLIIICMQLMKRNPVATNSKFQLSTFFSE